MHADRHVGHEADLHAGVLRGLLSGSQLFVGDPFQPAVEVQCVGELSTQPLHLVAVLVEALLPAVGFAGRRAPLVVAQAPRGVGLKPFGGRALVVVERLLTLLAAPGLKNQPQGVHLHAPHRITVDNLRIPVQRFGLRVQLADLRFQFIAEAGIFLDRLGTNVREVDEAAGNRQVRRRGERRYRLARVQRVDQHEIGAGLAVRIDHEGLEVLEIAHAPGSGGPDGIQLGHPAPQLVMFHGRQHRNTLGGADQRGVLRAVAHADMQRMVSHRQIRGYGDGCRRHELAVDLVRLRSVSGSRLQRTLVFVAVFQCDGCGGNLHDTGVEQHTIFLADDMQHGRGDETPVALAKDTDNGIIDGVIVMGVHAQRTQQRLQDIIIDLVIVVAHADVARGQSNQTRQMDQRTRETLRTFCTLCHIP